MNSWSLHCLRAPGSMRLTKAGSSLRRQRLSTQAPHILRRICPAGRMIEPCLPSRLMHKPTCPARPYPAPFHHTSLHIFALQTRHTNMQHMPDKNDMHNIHDVDGTRNMQTHIYHNMHRMYNIPSMHNMRSTQKTHTQTHTDTHTHTQRERERERKRAKIPHIPHASRTCHT